MNDFDNISIFSDDTELFRTPSEPDEGDIMSVRIRITAGAAARVTLMLFEPSSSQPMKRLRSGRYFDTYQAQVLCMLQPVVYVFLIETMDGRRIVYRKNGPQLLGGDENPDQAYAFRVTPGFHVPAWARGAIQYQLFVDRFRNGCRDSDVVDNEYYYINGHARHLDWDTRLYGQDIRHFYGGDLQGVMEKLDYLQTLGVEAIYMNPIFVSPSSHKYDTQDYEHVDPHLAVIVDDLPHTMQDWEQHNGFAPQYIRRVTSAANLKASDDYFAKLCAEIHRRGMKIILDGVFNHCGSYNKWMDREGIYVSLPDFAKGAYQDVNSPYRPYFYFHGDSNTYEGWWGHDTLPKLNYENSPELRQAVYAVAEKWASPPYSIDGWRLDVAADLGGSPEYNHSFWREFRRRVKAANPNLIIIAEHYGDAAPWLQGDQWDTVMNYDAFMEPLTFFLTGMEKHSDWFSQELFRDGHAFFRTMRDNMARMQAPSLQSAMNELSNHDHSRFLTRTNRRVGRLDSAGGEAADIFVCRAVLREAVVVQMTWPGCPTIYYGDEAGQTGWTDPDCRRPYPWGREDRELIDLHRDLAALRRAHPVFSRGSVMEMAAGHGLIAYARFDARDCALVAVNNTDHPLPVSMPVRETGVREGTRFVLAFQSDDLGHACPNKVQPPVKDGILTVTLPPNSGSILLKR